MRRDKEDENMTISAEELAQVRANIQASLERLRLSDPRKREQGCAELSDFLEYYIGRGGYGMNEERRSAFECEIRNAMEALLDVAVREQDPSVIESSLSALYAAVNYAAGEREVNWEPLAAKLDEFTRTDDADAVMFCLASTGEPKYRPFIAKLLQHAIPEIRASAAEQLRYLDMNMNIQTGRRAFEAGQSETQALELEQGKSVLAHFEPSCVILGYYVRPSEMGNRSGTAWQSYRAALKRFGLADDFNRSAKSSRTQ
jgi:hypothetical protein